MQHIHTKQHIMTINSFAEQHGKRPEAVYMKLRRAFPGVSFSKDSELTSAHLAALQTDKRGAKIVQPAKAQTPQISKPKAHATSEPVRRTMPQYRTAILGILLVAPTAASVSNMYHVSHQITQEAFTAWLYTVVLSASALGFTIAGVRSWITYFLSAVLIGFETFCNLSRLYYGLMGGVEGNPTRFLGTVTEIFSSGSHGTALAIAAFSALMLAAVQYAAIFELNKKR